VNEAALTGNPHDISKTDEFPFLIEGTNMVAGYGYMVTVAVGPHTFRGNINKLIHAGQDEPTSLQHRLEVIGHKMGSVGLIGMLFTVVVLLGHFGIEYAQAEGPFSWENRYTARLVRNLVASVVLLVVVLPESLPLALHQALGHAVKHMMRDSNLVRHIDSCEKMSRATSIVANKTGTITWA
jgi:Ca2+-transporting ATPase